MRLQTAWFAPSVLAAGMAVAFGAGGCCHVPRIERYFDRGDPMTSVNGFVYAIEVGEWDFAYQSLTEESKKLFTYTKFKWALRFNLEVPEIKIPIRDLIVNAERQRFRLWESKHKAELVVVYNHPNGETLHAKIFLVRESAAEAKAAGREEDPIWLIDFDQTIRSLPVNPDGTS